jgi:hypothetical protein
VLDQHTTFSGSILQTGLDLTIGQVLPGNTQYNFKGILDDIRLYDYALSAAEIIMLYQEPVYIDEFTQPRSPQVFYIAPSFPNPFNPQTTISYGLAVPAEVSIMIHDILGKPVCTLWEGQQEAGHHSLQWYGTDDSGNSVDTGVYLCRIQLGDNSKTIKMVYLK